MTLREQGIRDGWIGVSEPNDIEPYGVLWVRVDGLEAHADEIAEAVWTGVFRVDAGEVVRRMVAVLRDD